MRKIFLLLILIVLFAGCSFTPTNTKRGIVQKVSSEKNTPKKINLKKNISEKIAEVLIENGFVISKLKPEIGIVETEYKTVSPEKNSEEKKLISLVTPQDIKIYSEVRDDKYFIIPMINRGNDYGYIGENHFYISQVEKIAEKVREKIKEKEKYNWEIIAN